jgi:hypothetical protein
MDRFELYSTAIADAARRLHDYGYDIHTEKWQGQKIDDSPQHAMRELLLHSFTCRMPVSSEQAVLEIKPNLPWADDHFQERVGGKPLNPGNEYKNWPYYKHNAANDKHRVEAEKFSHTYMERMWPKHANLVRGAAHVGIRYKYGDLADVVKLLVREPDTRQAFLPIWFPEDTGVNFGGRVPCTIGYHFIRRGGYLHVVYYIRSCDFFRHFRDDIYLCDKLVRWIIEECIATPEGGGDWLSVKPGLLTMHITSLHCFAIEKGLLDNAR